MSRVAVLLLGLAAAAGVVYALLALGGEDRPLPEPERGRPAPSGRSRPPEPVPDVSAPDHGEVPPYPFLPPRWKREMRETLAGARITLSLVERPLTEIVSEAGGLLPYPVVLDATVPRAGRELTVRLRDLDGLMAIRVLEHTSGLSHYLLPGEIRLAPGDALPPPEGPEAVLAAIEEARAILRAGGPIRPPLSKLLPIRISDDTVWRAAAKVAARLRVPVKVTAEVDDELRKARVDVDSDTMTAGEVLDEIAGAARLSWAVDGRRIVIAERPRAEELRRWSRAARDLAAKEVEVLWDELPLFEVVRDLEEIAGVPVRVDRALWEPDHPRVTLRPGPEPLERVLRMLAGELGAAHLLTGDAIYIVRP